MGYAGPDRRRHKVYVTRNTEYHVKDDVCVAVRDRSSRGFRAAHIALRLRVEGGVRFLTNGAVIPSDEPPQVGESLFFVDASRSAEEEDEARQIVTSRIERIARPPKADVSAYPALR